VVDSLFGNNQAGNTADGDRASRRREPPTPTGAAAKKPRDRKPNHAPEKEPVDNKDLQAVSDLLA
jgi:hypothetical protein